MTTKKLNQAATNPAVVTGSHLTVTTWLNGKTELKWDDDALLKDVQAATYSFTVSQMKPSVRAKTALRKRGL